MSMKIISRIDAKTFGLKSYFTGKPCKHGHVALRKTVNGTCKECEKIGVEAWKAANREKHLEAMRRWGRNNPEKRRASVRARIDKDPEKHYSRMRKAIARWAAENPGKKCANESRRRAKKRNVGGHFTDQDIAKIFKMQKGKCAYCHVSLGKRYDRDHIIPLSAGGSNWPSNIQLLCDFCNSSKGAKHPVEYARALGRLL